MLGFDNKLLIRLQSIARILGAVVFILGIITIIEWNYSHELLVGASSILPPMNPLTAVEFILCGLAIFFAMSASSKKISIGISFLVIIIALLKLVDDFIVHIPIDQIIFSSKLGFFNPPSRMAPVTAINFILASLSLLAVNFNCSNKKKGLASSFALIIIISSLFLTLGYLFGAEFFPQLRIAAYNQLLLLSPLAPSTAFAFIFVGSAILLMCPNAGFMALLTSSSEIGFVTRRLALVAIMAPIAINYLGMVLIQGDYVDMRLGGAIIILLMIITLELFVFLNARQLESIWEERNKLEKEIMGTKAFDEALLSSIGDAVVAVNKEGFILFLNKEGEEFFSIEAKNAMGKYYAELWSISDKEGTVLSAKKRPIEIVLETEKKLSSTLGNHYVYITKDKAVPVSITVSPIILDKELIGAVAVWRDISKDFQIDKAKSEFISLASHQLSTPSTAISWMVESFLKKYEKKIDAEQNRALQDIYQANKMIKDLVNDFLNVSRIELGGPEVLLKPIDISSIIKEIISDKFKVQIFEKNMKIVESYDKDPIIKTDEKFLKMAIENIISNAIKYTPKDGKVTIKVEKLKNAKKIGDRELKKGGCLVCVTDTGYGIPKEQQGQIFTKLFRADNIRKKDIEGTGLGLYMVKLFVDKLGGEVWFESEENKGSKFFIYLIQ